MSGRWTSMRQPDSGSPPGPPSGRASTGSTDEELFALAASFTSRDPTVVELVERIANAHWFVRTGRMPAPVEQRLLNEVARSSNAPAAAWLDGWESVPEVTARLDTASLGQVDALREHARQAVAAAGRREELAVATQLCSSVVPAHAIVPPGVSERAVMLAYRVAAYWLNGLVTVAIAGTEPGPVDAAGQLLLWGRLPIGVDDAGWWVL